MTVAAASAGASVPAQTYPLDPRLATMVAKLPADQQAAATSQLRQLNPGQQQQVLAQAMQQASGAQAGSGADAAPAAGASGMADATTGATMTKPPNKILTMLKFVGIGAAAGAALGFGASFLTLPIIGKVAAPIAAAVGGGIGALAGLFLGMKSSAAKQQAYDEEQAAAAQAQVTTTPAKPESGAAPGSAAQTAGTAKSKRSHAASGAAYTVVQGDSLSKIARQHGDFTWQQLYELNRETIGSNPNLIHPGLKLRLPT